MRGQKRARAIKNTVSSLILPSRGPWQDCRFSVSTACRLSKKGGHFLALKGRAYAEEAEEAKKAIKVMGGSHTEVREVHLPDLEDKRAIIIVTKTMPTPKAYPRKAGTPAKNPL